MIGTGMTMPYWDFMGSTMVTNNYIRITPDLQSKQGALWNSVVSITTFFFVYVIWKKKIYIYISHAIKEIILKLIIFIAMSCTKLGIAS